MLQRTKQPQAWRNFSGTHWKREIDVRDFIVSNVTPYAGGPDFLVAPTKRTPAVWEKLQPYFREEAKKGVLDVDANTPSSLTSHGPGYIDRDNEVIVGLQTDKPFRRAIMPTGGYKMVEDGLKAIGLEVDPAVRETFTKYRKTHNDAVFDLYTPEIRACRKSQHHHRAAGRLRARPHHRRLPARGAVWRGPSDRGQEGRARPDRRPLAVGRSDAVAHGDGRPTARARRPQDDGGIVWLRHRPAGGECARGRAVDLLRLPRRHQGDERRRDVGRAASRPFSTSTSSAISPRKR